MFAVIFKARVSQLDDEYSDTAAQMRQLAFNNYGCLDFISLTEGDLEVAISYWNSKEDIAKWKQDPEHIKAQELGRARWYSSYSVEIVEIIQEYSY